MTTQTKREMMSVGSERDVNGFNPCGQVAFLWSSRLPVHCFRRGWMEMKACSLALSLSQACRADPHADRRPAWVGSESGQRRRRGRRSAPPLSCSRPRPHCSSSASGISPRAPCVCVLRTPHTASASCPFLFLPITGTTRQARHSSCLREPNPTSLAAARSLALLALSQSLIPCKILVQQRDD